MTRLTPFWTALAVLGAFVLGFCAQPMLTYADSPSLYEQWAAEATANSDPVTALAYAEHVARVYRDPIPLLRLTWPETPVTAVMVASCESGGFAADVLSGHRIGAAGEVGIMQVHGIHRGTLAAAGYDWHAVRYDVATNIAAARLIWERAGSWLPWSCFTRTLGVGGW